jgi:hypothetical protein
LRIRINLFGRKNLSRPGGSLRRCAPLAYFDNSKYWFRRVGRHPVYEPLHRAAARLAADAPPAAAFLREQKAWDPFAFVDLCEASLAERAPCEELCREIQTREWELLFDYCYGNAFGARGA